jgi:predicted transglutaminase-like cysteine proteinase
MRHICAFVLGLGLIAVTPSQADASKRLAAVGSVPVATRLAELGDSKMPIGWFEFCKRNAADCRGADLPAEDVVLTQQTWKLIVSINAKVNTAIEPITDLEQWGVVERWDYPVTGKGDCEDYVLEKRRLLINAGLPRQALLITVVRDHKGDGHAVLTVKTDRGDFVLDNQNGAVLPWAATGYQFVKRQAQHNPNIWVSLGAPKAPVSTASR